MPYTYKELMDIEIAVEAARNAARAMGNDQIIKRLEDATYIMAEIRLAGQRLSSTSLSEERAEAMTPLLNLFIWAE